MQGCAADGASGFVGRPAARPPYSPDVLLCQLAPPGHHKSDVGSKRNDGSVQTPAACRVLPDSRPKVGRQASMSVQYR
eukprot:362716-Chlamydomonas_euryale.AAC.11